MISRRQSGISFVVTPCRGVLKQPRLCSSRKWSPRKLGVISDLYHYAMSPTKSCLSCSTRSSQFHSQISSPLLKVASFSDNILMAQEIIHHFDLRYKNNNLVIKLDMSKAYDRVDWNFLLLIMEKMGFPSRFLSLIKHAIQDCWFTVLVNGEMAGFSKSSQGLRQGDPISPTLFIIAAEAFSKGIDHLFIGNPNMHFQTKCEVKISHLSYADDVIIFTNCKEAGLIRLMNFLRKFEEQSGQQINQVKSAFILGRKANLITNRIKNITGFSMKALPITYLGAPLYKGNKRKVLYENLINKSEKQNLRFGELPSFLWWSPTAH
ncbi:UNVERIFIED_CONTAM: hypothetical protein Sangu_2869800 [Sesamum angustifolium]|uniref:Reverse transcriptase domain-containing protein n=1 Tax=Sesamum angustifolium TaxID=2727405 RepID=A0AAW2IQ12_9LAMI